MKRRYYVGEGYLTLLEAARYYSMLLGKDNDEISIQNTYNSFRKKIKLGEFEYEDYKGNIKRVKKSYIEKLVSEKTEPEKLNTYDILNKKNEEKEEFINRRDEFIMKLINGDTGEKLSREVIEKVIIYLIEEK